jgi:ATP adenylyltransferase
MERLWSPWRLDYVTGSSTSKADVGCVFCTEQDLAEADSLIVYRGARCYVILNRYPYNPGHLMALPNRHVPALADLSVEELHELADLTKLSEAALLSAYRPQGINVGINLGLSAGAGIREHLHVHLVPRWSGDTNFISVVGNTRVLPEELHQSALRLRPVFKELAEKNPEAGEQVGG